MRKKGQEREWETKTYYDYLRWGLELKGGGQQNSKSCEWDEEEVMEI